MKENTNWTSEDKINLLNSLCIDEVISSISDENLRKKILDYKTASNVAMPKEIAEKQLKAKKTRISELRSRFQTFSLRALYPFRCFRFFYQTDVLVYDSKDKEEYVFNKIFTADELNEVYNAEETVIEKGIREIDSGKEIPEGFITRKEFENLVLGPFLRVDGRILSIPREERFKLMVVSRESEDETAIGCIDLLTGFGGYPGGRLLKEMKESIKEEIKAGNCRELKKANMEYNFFFLDEYKFVPRSCEEVPDFWGNICPGNQIYGLETHDFKYWREALLEKHGFKNTDFSYADKIIEKGGAK